MLMGTGSQQQANKMEQVPLPPASWLPPLLPTTNTERQLAKLTDFQPASQNSAEEMA